eukprot:scaffold51572_cov67-Phaeocystis_antarctica.AAC.1
MVAIVACLARWSPHGLMLVLRLPGDSVVGKARVRAWHPGNRSTSMASPSLLPRSVDLTRGQAAEELERA